VKFAVLRDHPLLELAARLKALPTIRIVLLVDDPTVLLAVSSTLWVSVIAGDPAVETA
jgi:hypothetical protein